MVSAALLLLLLLPGVEPGILIGAGPVFFKYMVLQLKSLKLIEIRVNMGVVYIKSVYVEPSHPPPPYLIRNRLGRQSKFQIRNVFKGDSSQHLLKSERSDQTRG